MPALLPVSDLYAVGFNDTGQAGAARTDGSRVDMREARRLAHAYREELLHQVGHLTAWLKATEQESRIVLAPAGAVPGVRA